MSISFVFNITFLITFLFALQTRNYGVNTTNYYTPKWSIAHAFYSNVSLLHKAGVTVSFGIPKDGFYTATNYTSW